LLAVEPSYARKGLGRRLIAAAEEYVRSLGADRLSLSVTQRGSDLIHLYEAVGYEKVQEFHWPGVRDPSWIMLKVFAA